ncbi:MAG TPA: hypothetical protein VMW38_19350, partial [Terriglobia bacterium]|nr:hypothetical protein [Terriglobia bacterium]
MFNRPKDLWSTRFGGRGAARWRLDICEAAGGRFFLIEPRWGRQTVAQGAVSGRSSGPPSPRRPPWVG